MAPRAIFFDLDSALTSRGRSLENFGERFAGDFAARLGTITARGVAYGLAEVDGNGFRAHAELAAELRDLFPWRERPSVEELTAYWDDVFPTCVAPDPEVAPTLRWLHARGIALGALTNGAAAAQRARLAALGLGALFTMTVISREVGAAKLDPHIYLRALRESQVPPTATWMVSALPEDGLGARAAGLHAIFLRRVFYWPRDAEPPAHEITSLRELPPLVNGPAH
jgi:putative hydrolase of the HAD superfamily